MARKLSSVFFKLIFYLVRRTTAPGARPGLRCHQYNLLRLSLRLILILLRSPMAKKFIVLSFIYNSLLFPLRGRTVLQFIYNYFTYNRLRR